MTQFIVKYFWGDESCSGISTSPYLAKNKEAVKYFLKSIDIENDYCIMTLEEWLDGQRIIE